MTSERLTFYCLTQLLPSKASIYPVKLRSYLSAHAPGRDHFKGHPFKIFFVGNSIINHLMRIDRYLFSGQGDDHPFISGYLIACVGGHEAATYYRSLIGVYLVDKVEGPELVVQEIYKTVGQTYDDCRLIEV